MVRDVLLVNTVSRDTFAAQDAGKAISLSNDAELSVASTSMADNKALMLRFSISAATAGDTITIKAQQNFSSPASTTIN